MSATQIDFLLSGFDNAKGGTVTAYAAGTTTLKTMWLDREKQTPADNPYTLNASRGAAQLYGEGIYKFVIKDSTGQVITGGTLDNISVGFFSDAPWIDVSEYASLTAAIAAIGSTEAELLVDSTTTVTANGTVPSTLKLKVTHKGRINQGAYTLAINSAFNAEAHPIFTGTGAISFGTRAVRWVLPEWFGVVPEAVGSTAAPATNYSTQFNMAINMGLPVKLGKGDYWVNAVHTTGNLVIEGAGSASTYIRSYTATGYAFSERSITGGWSPHLAMSNLQISGDPAGGSAGGRNGFVFGDPAGSYLTSIELAGRAVFNNVAFWNCDKAVYKPYGNIGNTFNKCSWAGNVFGYYAKEDPPHNMNVSYDNFNEGEFNTCSLAAVYIDGSNYTAGQTTFNQIIFESNPGFAIFVYAQNTAIEPIALNGVHFESNATDVSTTINGTAYTPVDLYVRNTPYIVSRGSRASTLTLVNSVLHEVDCTYPVDATATVDSNSLIISDRPNMSYTAATNNRYYESIGGVLGPDGGSANVMVIPPRSRITRAYTRIGGNDYANADTYAFAGTASINATTVADGVLFDSCAEITVANGQTEVDNTAYGSLSFTADKWYVWTVDIKLLTTAKPDLSAAGAATFFPDISASLVKDKWVTIGGITKRTSTSTASIPRIANTSGSNVTLRLSAFQVIEFDTKGDALKYLNAGLYQPTARRPRITYSSAAPTTGTWAVGDRVYNAVPAVGQPKSWACTVAGTPGTWVSEGNL